MSFLDRINPLSRTVKGLETKVSSLEKELMLVGDGTGTTYFAESESRFSKAPKSKILQYCDYSPLVQPVVNSIVREVTNAGWELKPMFNHKCPKCEETFDDVEGETCPTCSVPLISPDPKQKKILNDFIDNPNPDVDLYSIIRSALKWVLSIDDYYISVSYVRKNIQGQTILFDEPQALFVENALYIENYNGEEYFCPLCNATDGRETVKNEKGRCPEHNVELWQTAFVLLGSATIKKRYSKKEIIEGHFNRRLPERKGTPILTSCINQIEATMNLDLLKRDTFEKGTLAKIFAFEGYTQDEVNALQRNIAAMTDKRRSIRNKIFNLFLGNSKGKIEIHDVLSDPSKLQELEWHRYYRDMILSNYGVTPVFAGTVESGKAGNNPMLQIDVMADTTKAWMRTISEPFNTVLMPALSVTDWYFDFIEIEDDNSEQLALLEKTKAETFAIYNSAGYDAELLPDGRFKATKREIEVPEPDESPDDSEYDYLDFYYSKSKIEKDWHDYIPDKLLDDIQAALESVSQNYEKHIQDIINSHSQNLDRSKMAKEIEAEVMDSAKAYDAVLKHYLFPIFQDGYMKVFREYSRKLNKANVDSYALAYLQEFFDKYITPFFRSWLPREKDKIFSIVEEEALEGYNWQKVKKRLSEYFQTRDSYYWRMVARTEGTRAFIGSGNAAAQELGVTERRVIFRDDGRGCEDCAEASYRGWHKVSDSLPEGDIPFHPHCRCYYEYRTEEMKQEGYGE